MDNADPQIRKEDLSRRRGVPFVVERLVWCLDGLWRAVGARNGLQEVEEVGGGWEDWYWRRSVGNG